MHIGVSGDAHSPRGRAWLWQNRRHRPLPPAKNGNGDNKPIRKHGAKSDLMESRAAFAEKRKPNFKGWNDPEDRHRLPTLDSVK